MRRRSTSGYRFYSYGDACLLFRAEIAMSALQFEILAHRRRRAHRRHCILPRGEIDTPAFMPVGTAATVKAMLPESVRATGADIVLGNTYHLMLRPGAERIARLGGLHKFMNWPQADPDRFRRLPGDVARRSAQDQRGGRALPLAYRRIGTFSFARARDGNPASARLRHPDGAGRMRAVPRERSEIEKSLALSMRWAKRSKAAFGETARHGLVSASCRAACIRICAGARQKNSSRSVLTVMRSAGLRWAKGRPAMFESSRQPCRICPPTRPRYLMGVGKPDDIVGAALRGIDMFDCVLPTRSGRNGQAFTWKGPLNLRNARHADDDAPLDRNCACNCCRSYSRAYLHHVVKGGEIIASMLLTWHNLTFFQELMRRLSQGRCAANRRRNSARSFWGITAAAATANRPEPSDSRVDLSPGTTYTQHGSP